MRLPFGYEIRRLARQQEPDGRNSTISIASSRRSWQSPLGIEFNGTIKPNVDYAVYESIVRGIPFVDVALRKLSRMICRFDVACDNESTQEELNVWLKTCTVEDIFTGFTPFLRPYVRQGMLYGKTGGEIVLSPTMRDVAGLVVLPAKQIRLIPTPEGLQIGQDNATGMAVPYENQDLIVYSALNKEGDNPHGVSILRSVPWVADIALRMENALRQMWQRTGAPSMAIIHTIPPDVVLSTEEVNARQSAIESDWYNSQEARGNEEGIMDFIAAIQGGISFQAIGSDVKELSFVEPIRVFWEQVISTVELAPFMLGLQWSTTERLSQQQADSIIGACDDMRSEIEPDILRILDWVQRLRGLKGTVEVSWQDINLQDSVETARADLTKAQAQKQRMDNALSAWANGFIDQQQASEESGYDGAVLQQLDAPVKFGQSAAPSDAGGADSAANALWARFP